MIGKQKKRNRFVSFILFIVFIMTLLFPFPVSAAPENLMDKTNAGMSLSRGVIQQDLRQYNGKLIVYVLGNNGWSKAGELPFDKYVHLQELDLVDLPSGTETTVRLEKSGGGAAHLDAVFLGGVAPARVNGGGGLPLAKLVAMDNDLINIDGGGVEVAFEAGRGSMLTVAARVEPVVISKIPFQFPCNNTYRTMNENSAFYTYEFNQLRQSLELGEMLECVAEREPFFKEYVVPGSGHPPGYVYGWVMNDDENLYVALDFTPDNTVDGELDYAKVYILTTDGLKEFRVTQSEQTWGRANFTYTDKVNYEHKFYEFNIPLKEIGIADASAPGSEVQEIQIAFAAYGTASVTDDSNRPAVAYNPDENNYLSVYTYNIPPNGAFRSEVVAQLVDADAKSVSTKTIAENTEYERLYLADVAYGDDCYLVVWEREANYDSPDSIYGCIVDTEGNPDDGGFFQINNKENYCDAPAVAFDGEKFLVVWNYANYPDHEIFGRFVDLDGNMEDEFSVSEGSSPAVTYNPDSEKYIVAYESDNGSSIRARFIEKNGTVEIDEIIVCNIESPYLKHPDVAYDSDKGRFLVAWESQYSELGIYGRFLNTDGPLGDDFIINEPSVLSYPRLAYDSGNGRFLAVWQERAYDYDSGYFYFHVQGCLLDSNVPEEPFDITAEANTWSRPAMAFNSSNDNFLVAYHTLDEYGEDIDYVLVPPEEEIGHKYSPALAFNPGEGSYLCIFGYDTDQYQGEAYVNKFHIAAERVDQDGQVIPGSFFEIYNFELDHEHIPTALAFADDSSEVSLAVWACDRKVFGRLVDDEGPVGDVIELSADGSRITHRTGVAFDSANGQFLVVWDYWDTMSDLWRVYGVFMDAENGKRSEVLDISSGKNPALAYDSSNERFLVTWDDSKGSSNIYGQFIKYSDDPDEFYVDGRF